MRPTVLVYGYGLLSRSRDRIVAGQKMSGLALYNSILLEGLGERFSTAFVCGRIGLKRQDVVYRQVEPFGLVAEYDAQFPDLFEEHGMFQPNLAQKWYSDRVWDSQNPVYQQLATSLIEVINVVKPNVINAHNLNTACALIRASHMTATGLPVIILTVHDIDHHQLNFVVQNQGLFSAFIAISRSVKDELLSSGIDSGKIALIRNGLPLKRFTTVDLSLWSEIAGKLGISEEGGFQILIPARRVPGKGIEFAIKAFARLARQATSPMRLLITGAGMADTQYELSLKSLVSSLKPKYPVVFLDAVRYEWMPYLYATSDVSLLPSVSQEGFGYANLEAMATGGPIVITCNHGGVLDYLKNSQTGILIKPQSVDAVYDALYSVLKNPDTAADIVTRATGVSLKYSADIMLSAYWDLIERVIVENGAHV